MNRQESEQDQHRIYREAVSRNGWESKLAKQAGEQEDAAMAQPPIDFHAHRQAKLFNESGDPLQLVFPHDVVANTPEEIEELSNRYDAYVTLKAGMNQQVVWEHPQPQGSLDLLYEGGHDCGVDCSNKR